MFNDYCKFSSILIRLNRNIEEIKKDFKYFWKYSLNKSLKLKVNTEIINKEDDFKLFLERYLQFKKINNFKGISSKILFKLFHNQNKYDKIFLLNSYYNSKYCGSICISIHGKSATYIASIFNDHGKKYNINNLLLWRAIEYLQKLNIIYFDLGGVNLNENSGINFFKKGLGGNEYKLINESIFI